jgi:hypothetical protein
MPEIAVVGVERASKARPVALCPSKPRRHSNEYEPSASFRVADSLEVGRFCELPNQTGIARLVAGDVVRQRLCLSGLPRWICILATTKN